MLIYPILVTLIIICSTSIYAQSSDNSQSITKMVNLLKPFVRQLDRDVWTFRYEAQDSFSPNTIYDLKPRIANWSNRFWNADIMRGADVGPGVYVATDPVATATWGGVNPRLFAIRLKPGSNILVGDQQKLSSLIRQKSDTLSYELGCQKSSTSMGDSIGSIVGFFRMNEIKKCREVLIEAFRILSIQALTYRFHSVALDDCRVTGTAISIVNPQAVSLEELNWYSENGNIESRPDITPFIKALYFESASDFYSQSLLASRDTLKRFKNAFGFFDQLQMPADIQFNKWKKSSILKCGPKWNIETVQNQPNLLLSLKKQQDAEIKSLLIELSLTYREKWLLNKPTGLPSEFQIQNLKALRVYPNFNKIDNIFRYQTAQIPIWSSNTSVDRQQYIKILNQCLEIYSSENLNLTDILNGNCGFIAEN